MKTSSSPDSSPTADVAALSRQLQNIKFALDQAAIVAVTNPAGAIIYANDKFCEITGYSREELIGKNHRIIKSGFHPPEFFKDLWRTISSGKIWVGEIRNRAKDGHYYWVYTTIVPLMSADGKPEEYIAIRFEITARKEAERQLAESAAKLAQSNRELQDFASVAAHDLQEPLRKVQAFSDRVRSRMTSLLSSLEASGTFGPGTAEGKKIDEMRDYLERMGDAARRMQTLINDLLTYSRVSTQAQPPVLVKLNQVIADVMTDLELRIEQSHATMRVGELPEIEADASQMRQLFQNLLLNALKFHKKDVPPVVEVSATVENGICEVLVRDLGIGFDEKYLSRIFTLFQRLHGRHEYEGTGLGLAVCKRIVDRHGGDITARSTPGEGATFIVRLPVKASKGEAV